MAVSRAERRWSKEPKIETILSVMDWLFTRASLICAARSLSVSAPTTTTPPAPPPLLLDGIPICVFSQPEFLFGCERKTRERKTRERNTQKGVKEREVCVWGKSILRNCKRNPVLMGISLLRLHFHLFYFLPHSVEIWETFCVFLKNKSS